MKFKKSNLENVTITFQGEQYPAKLNFQALSELEEITEKPFIEIFNNFAKDQITMKDLLAIIYVAMKSAGVEVAWEDMYGCDLLSNDMPNIINGVTTLLLRSQTVATELAAAATDKKKKPDAV